MRRSASLAARVAARGNDRRFQSVPEGSQSVQHRPRASQKAPSSDQSGNNNDNDDNDDNDNRDDDEDDDEDDNRRPSFWDRLFGRA